MREYIFCFRAPNGLISYARVGFFIENMSNGLIGRYPGHWIDCLYLESISDSSFEELIPALMFFDDHGHIEFDLKGVRFRVLRERPLYGAEKWLDREIPRR